MEMDRRKNYVLIAILILILAGAAIYYGRETPESALVRELQDRVRELKGQEGAIREARGIPEEKERLIGIYVKRPNFEIESRGLVRVEVWAVPTGSGILSKDHRLLGNGKKHSEENGHQTWLVAIPQEALSVTEIYVKGFTFEDKEVEPISLAALGATEIHQAVWED